MTYIENIFVCIAAPLLVAAFLYGEEVSPLFSLCLCGYGGMSDFGICKHFFCRLLWRCRV